MPPGLLAAVHREAKSKVGTQSQAQCPPGRTSQSGQKLPTDSTNNVATHIGGGRSSQDPDYRDSERADIESMLDGEGYEISVPQGGVQWHNRTRPLPTDRRY